MRAHGVVMAPPEFDENLGFLEGVEDLPVQELVVQPRVEALNVPILPERSRRVCPIVCVSSAVGIVFPGLSWT